MSVSLWCARHLTVTMTRRQYQLRYRQSMVGVLWAIVPTIATLAAGTLVFHRVIQVETGTVPYTVFALSAMVPWTFFANSLSAGIPSVSQFQPVISRLAFPRAALPLASVGTSLIDLAASAALFIVFVYASGSKLPLTSLLFPMIVGLELIFAAGICLFGSALNVFARDIRLGAGPL